MLLLTPGLSGLLCSVWMSVSAPPSKKKEKRSDTVGQSAFCRSATRRDSGPTVLAGTIVFWWMKALSWTRTHTTDPALFRVQVSGFKLIICEIRGTPFAQLRTWMREKSFRFTRSSSFHEGCDFLFRWNQRDAEVVCREASCTEAAADAVVLCWVFLTSPKKK